MKIVLSAVLAMFLTACGDNATAEKNIQESVQNETPKAAEELKVEENKTVTSPSAEEKTPVEEVKQVVETIKAEEQAVPVKVAAPKTVVQNSVDAEALFAKCIACHGQNAEKSALGKSQVIKGWSVDKTLSAFHGYKDGTYGGAMKGIMKSQISNYTEEELKALAQHISKL